jgi:DNA-binding NarL/FixJ family response regulator
MLTPSHWGLTDDDVRVIWLVAEGFSNRQIAAQTGFTPCKVKHSIQKMLAIFCVNNRVGLAVASIRSGIVNLQELRNYHTFL